MYRYKYSRFGELRQIGTNNLIGFKCVNRIVDNWYLQYSPKSHIFIRTRLDGKLIKPIYIKLVVPRENYIVDKEYTYGLYSINTHFRLEEIKRNFDKSIEFVKILHESRKLMGDGKYSCLELFD